MGPHAIESFTIIDFYKSWKNHLLSRTLSQDVSKSAFLIEETNVEQLKR